MLTLARLIPVALLSTAALADVFTNQQPAPNGGVSRWSQLWQDPGPDGNDLDSDAICWEDFVLAQPSSIDHIEWWGSGACELGFQIEIWRQDPGTVAYQPLAVFDVYGNSGVRPEARFVTNSMTATPAPGGLTHFSLNLATPISLPANDASNPRWFIGIIAHTQQPYATWNWAQGLGGSSRTYQWIRGYHRFFSLGEGRALVLSGSTPCIAPGITSNPADLSTCPHAGASLSLSASGSGPLSFVWQIESAPNTWLPLSDTQPFNDITFSGADTPTLQFEPLSLQFTTSAFRVRCVITNDCGSATSRIANVAICPADFNCDGFPDFFDFDAFVQSFEAGDPAADIDADGFIDFFDLDAFVSAFEAGC